MTDASPPKTRILLVDDEPRLTELLRLELDVEGYEVSVAENGASGLIKARSEPPPNLIILDWNLPDFTGVDVCQRIRSSGIKTPILMLTGNDDVTDRVKALDAGVDDYLTKPFSIEELMARLRAMQRRAEKFSGETDVEQIPETLQVADLKMNTSTRDVTRGERTIQLSVKEYELLHFLMIGAGKVHERDAIMKAVWGEDFFGDDNLLDVYIRYLRQKVEQKDACTLIHTVRGVGFILRQEQ
ncbi:MAG TPA: response regulator transcription factor [Prochlorococcus sp.]|jgi:DNA-binding response OmpR family regulator|nr:response regulator transcription factor [Prochlorococcaceae cyanobacterium ETNP18_MAG_17]|tara:strand:- start:1251 stop:1976 length:726 start_codon:yes stop_codon:yes gene_type:complete